MVYYVSPPRFTLTTIQFALKNLAQSKKRSASQTMMNAWLATLGTGAMFIEINETYLMNP